MEAFRSSRVSRSVRRAGPRTLVLSAWIGLSSPGAAAPAPASETARVAVFPLEFLGETDLSSHGHLQQALATAFQRGGFPVADPRLVAVAVRDPSACDPACHVRVAQSTMSSHVVRGTVTRRDRDWQIHLELASGGDGTPIASLDESCEICGLEEVAAVMSASAATLVTKLESVLRGSAGLNVTSTPAGAAVWIDGKQAGVTPFAGRLPPGRRVVQLSKAGHVTVEREVLVLDGITSKLAFDLQPQLRRPVDLPRLRPWGWASLAVGLASLGAGIGLLVLDGREEKPCSREDADGDCRRLYDTKWGGAGLLAGGAALGAVGLSLLVLDRGNRRRARLEAALGPTQATMRATF